ncbi:MAG: DUF3883 domain-containing protein [Planctomycetes bacterium]|nr:DUF3883 domain-containing protein [Planctomycetota bacterium]
MNSEGSPGAIISEAIDCGLIRSDGAMYVLSQTGLKVGKAQVSAQKKISASAQRVVIKFVYLNQSAGDRCCGSFLLNWIPDSDLNTFVFERSVSDGTEILTWLRLLERVGMISVDTERAFVNKEYLKLVNELLAEIRGIEVLPGHDGGMLRQVVGDIGEELALEYEKKRLKRNGYKYLLPLVEHISPIDNSAGYDIRSCAGIGKKPEERIHIEVKNTVEKSIQFTWSYNEQNVGNKLGNSYWIYCYCSSNVNDRTAKGPFRIKNPTKCVVYRDYVIERRDIFVKKINK